MNVRPAGPDPVFIVGLYKNGTSWLLSALAAHPQFSALRELDVLRSVGGRTGQRLLPRRERLMNVFGRSAFCALRAEQLASDVFRAHLTDPVLSGAASLYDLPPRAAVEVLTKMMVANGGVRDERTALDRPLGLLNLPQERLAAAFAALADGQDVPAAMEGFLSGLAPALPAGRRLVLKGADQILCLEALRACYATAPKIAIVRDGRDAAVSAFHYRELMRQRRMAWHHGYLSYLKPVALVRDAGISVLQSVRRAAGYGEDWRLGRSMSVWADRVRRVLAAAERGELYVLRYEDLLTDFDATFASLLRWLGADAAPATVAAVAKASAFETLSGRPRGVAGEDVMRKGVAGEWHENLNGRDQALAWRVAGTGLAAMGYTRDGDPGPFRVQNRSAPGTAGGK